MQEECRALLCCPLLELAIIKGKLKWPGSAPSCMVGQIVVPRKRGYQGAPWLSFEFQYPEQYYVQTDHARPDQVLRRPGSLPRLQHGDRRRHAPGRGGGQRHGQVHAAAHPGRPVPTGRRPGDLFHRGPVGLRGSGTGSRRPGPGTAVLGHGRAALLVRILATLGRGRSSPRRGAAQETSRGAGPAGAPVGLQPGAPGQGYLVRTGLCRGRPAPAHPGA